MKVNRSMIGLNGTLVALRQVLIIALITIVLLEAALRIFQQIHPLPIFYSNSYNRFRMKPHAPIFGFQLNSRGFMDVEFKTDKDEATFRMLGIGDSFAFGVVPYQYNYLTVLERELNANGARVELINMGVPGFNPREYLSILIHEGLELKPDMVLMSFFIGNDFTEAKKVSRLFRYFYVANVVKYLYDINTKFTYHGDPNTGAYDEEESLFTNDAYVEHERALSYIFVKRSRIFPGLLANTMDHLRNFKRICDAGGIRLTIVLIPDEVQVDRTLQRQVVGAAGLGGDAFDFDLPNELLKRQLAELGIDHLDLLQPFRDATTNTRLYKRNDTHWNIKGNELASEIILRHLLPRLSSSASR